MNIPTNIIDEKQLEISRKAYLKLQQYRVCILAMQMRTGKTNTSLFIAMNMFKHFLNIKNPTIFVVTILKVIEEDSFNKSLNALKPFFPDVNATIRTINYESLHHISQEEFNSFSFVIIDESHNLKAPGKIYFGKDRRPKYAGMLRTRFLTYKNPSISDNYIPYCLLMTGTPHSELSLTDLINPLFATGLYLAGTSNFFEFSRHYVNKEIKFHGVDRHTEYVDVNSVGHSILKDFIIYSTQENHNITTKITFHTMICPLTELQVHFAKALEKQKVLQHKNLFRIVERAVSLQNALHQIYSGSLKMSYLDTKKEVTFLFDNNAKISTLINLFEAHKSIVCMTMFVGEVDAIRANPFLMDKIHDGYLVADNIVKLSTGIDLSQYDAIVFFNVPFSCTQFEQACARLSNRNREHADIYILTSDSYFELGIFKLLQKKQSYSITHFRNYLNEQSRLSNSSI